MKILIVNNNPDFLRIIKVNLDLEGYETETAIDGGEALEKISGMKPDAVLVDSTLPSMTGLEFCRRMRENIENRNIPIIFLAEDADAEIPQWEGAVIDFLVKPVSMTRLMGSIQGIVTPRGETENAEEKETVKESIFPAWFPEYREKLPETKLAIVGEGPMGVPLLKFLSKEPKVRILAYADIDPESEGVELAHKLEIQTLSNYASLFEIAGLELIVSTGRVSILKLLAEDEEKEIVGKSALRFLLNIIEDREEKMEKERLLAQKLSHKVKEMSIIREVSSLFTSSLDLKVVLEKIVYLIYRLMKASASSIILQDADSGALTMAAYESILAEKPGRLLSPIESFVAEWVLAHNSPMVCKDIITDPRIRARNLISRDFLSMVGMPLMLRGRAIGVLSIFNKKIYDFSEDELALLSILADEAAIAIDNARVYEKITRTHRGFIAAFSDATDARDAYAHRHSVSVSILSRAIAEELHLLPDEVEAIENAALLHDLGKISVSDHILNKPGSLSPEEREIINNHPILGARIVGRIEGFKSMAPIIKHQYERWDGGGTPDGLKAENIPLGARIVNLAETFDALISKRSYRDAFSPGKAMKIIQEKAGSQFDPSLVDALLKILNKDDSFFVRNS